MRKFFLLLALMACSLTYAATTVLIDGLYYSLGTSSATVLADQSSGKTVYSAYTSVTIPASVTYEATKILRDGHLLIQRGDKTYTITGKEIR